MEEVLRAVRDAGGAVKRVVVEGRIAAVRDFGLGR